MLEDCAGAAVACEAEASAGARLAGAGLAGAASSGVAVDGTELAETGLAETGGAESTDAGAVKVEAVRTAGWELPASACWAVRTAAVFAMNTVKTDRTTDRTKDGLGKKRRLEIKLRKGNFNDASCRVGYRL